MATHAYSKYHLTPFWSDEYKQLEYVHEEFNDKNKIAEWLELGYPNKFTGQMCNMQKTQPEWNSQVVDIFTASNWKDIGTCYYKMDPGTILPMHQDLYKRYVDIFNLQGKEHTIRRAIIFLEDWQSGHYLECCGDAIANWSAGTVVEWKYDAPHLAANMGVTPRYTLQVTGHIDE
jgi:hypothetical protein